MIKDKANYSHYALWVGPLAIVVAMLDFAAKLVVMARIEPYSLIPVIPGFFNLTLTMNHGIAFGLFSDLGEHIRSMVVISLTLIAITAVFVFLGRFNYRSRLSQIAFGFILGGALGNILDRIQFGAVVDYLDFYVSSYHWPAFNLADSFICIGVGLLILHSPGERA